MALRKAKALTFRPTGLSDSQDGTNQFAGAMQILTNLVPNPATDKTFVPRPAAQPLVIFGGESASGGAPSTALWVVGSSCELLQFPLTANGNVAPTLNIQGALTQLTSLLVNGDDKSFSYAVDFDATGNQYVAAFKEIAGGTGLQYFFTVYAPGATGNIAPIRYVHGSNTGFDAILSQAGHAGICLDDSELTYVGIFDKVYRFPAASDGNAVGTVFLSGLVSDITLALISSLRFDPVRRWIWISICEVGSLNRGLNKILAYDLNGVLQVTLTDSTNWIRPYQVTIGPDLSIYVIDLAEISRNITVFVYAPNSTGDSLPVRMMTLPDTNTNPLGVAVDSNGVVYAAALGSKGSSLYVYPAGANDPVSPIQTIAGANTTFDNMLPGSSPPGATTTIAQLNVR